MDKIRVGFMGAGGIARAHAYSLNAVKFYYDNVPGIIFESVTSKNAASREKFAMGYSFRQAQDMQDFISNGDINTVFILGPNHVHFDHLQKALAMPAIKNIYLEKPVCSSVDEENQIRDFLKSIPRDIRIQVGFQYLQTSAVREALGFWRSGVLGKPVHFDLKYYHGDYLSKSYRDKRKSRLTSAPDGGAMADLGSHGISLLMAFFNEELQILHAIQGGTFEDVPEGSDLFSSITLVDPETHAVGHMSASRISSGSGDHISLEIFAEKGALRYSSTKADYFEYYLEKDAQWVKKPVGSNFQPVTSFPSGHVPAGWLRAMVHAHYIFLTGDHRGSFIPDLSHGLAAQRLVRETAFHINNYREHLREMKQNY
jgi:predicted dehydrogenase